MDEFDKKATKPTHVAGTNKGEEMLDKEGMEPGRIEGEKDSADRPTGKSTARMSSGINPQDPIDPASPNMPPD